MAGSNLEDLEKVIISTGNMLSLNDITKKPGQNPTEELIEAINITIKEFQNGSPLKPQPDHLLVITRPNDDLLIKMAEHDSSELKIGLKIFVTNNNQQLVIQAIEKAFITLNVGCVDDVIVAFKVKDNLDLIKSIWSILENYIKSEKIKQIGLADVEETTFRTIYEWATVKPSIIQINLATCCVVPPTLQAFCKENEVKLLTHSDPSDILPVGLIQNIFGKPLVLQWATRFLAHIKCRGVLATKGYLLSLDRD
ncbi:unnamed protein product [Brassicogethes aeneus]|uniref:GCS light chain n=1 Tax=Brassicogethes aeneus TaxID=1431903 RepID=A0A9P0FE91_BRAAE|nr:unnamed protein product [Brassicogethes aeneus]